VLHKPLCPGFFAHHLHVHGLLSISSVVRFYRHKLPLIVPYHPLFHPANGKSLSHVNAFVVWFLPELAETFPSLRSVDPEVHAKLEEYSADDWSLFGSLRARGVNPDPFATAIRADDADRLQKLIAGSHTDHDRIVPA
jgi:hypothetical protein